VTTRDYDALKALFNAALDRPADDRLAWLRTACGSNEALCREAEALLRAYDTAGDFLERPPTLAAADLLLLDDTPHPLPAGARIGPYEIRSELGRGGMGIVYLADDLRLGRAVALKAVAAAPDDERRRERLRREARAAAAVTHPAVATVYALEEYDGRLFIASEYVPGGTLRQAIDAGAIDRDRARAIALEIARGLAAAHAAGVVHRDLKPDNVVLSESGTVKVVDFGIAAVDGRDSSLTGDGALLGTPAYMAPEQLAGGEVDRRADIYAFGVVFFEMLTGRHPLHGPPPAGTIPAIVARCLQLDPAERFASGQDLLDALEGEARERPGDAAPGASTRWWWEFHQGAAAVVYWLMVIPAWHARALIGGRGGRIFFVVLLASVIVAANLRLNLWFTSRFHPAELRWVRKRAERWINTADWVFVITLLSAGVLIGEDRSVVAALCFSVAIGAALAFVFMEPAAARAAFRNRI
jgi:hypothetical protein